MEEDIHEIIGSHIGIFDEDHQELTLNEKECKQLINEISKFRQIEVIVQDRYNYLKESSITYIKRSYALSLYEEILHIIRGPGWNLTEDQKMVNRIRLTVDSNTIVIEQLKELLTEAADMIERLSCKK